MVAPPTPTSSPRSSPLLTRWHQLDQNDGYPLRAPSPRIVTLPTPAKKVRAIGTLTRSGPTFATNLPQTRAVTLKQHRARTPP